MINVVVKNVKDVSLLLTSKGLYQKPIVMGEKEERSALSHSFTSSEHHVTILLQGQRIDDIIRADIVHEHDLSKLRIFVTAD